jgi:hypothetical protein
MLDYTSGQQLHHQCHLMTIGVPSGHHVIAPGKYLRNFQLSLQVFFLQDQNSCLTKLLSAKPKMESLLQKCRHIHACRNKTKCREKGVCTLIKPSIAITFYEDDQVLIIDCNASSCMPYGLPRRDIRITNVYAINKLHDK